MKRKTYTVEASCFNCAKTFKVAIPKGTKVDHYKVTCPNCELPTVLRVEEKKGG